MRYGSYEMVENYLECCSELMRIYNISQKEHLHDADEPFREFRRLDCFASDEIAKSLVHIRDLFKQLKGMARDKDAFIQACKQSVELVQVGGEKLPFSQLVADATE